jgi:uncharacterized membrane protein YphA (DoxX/SURF4 family)
VDDAVLVARIALATVFLAAGVGKLLDLAGARAALFGFGVSRRVARLAGPLIPATELAAAAALVVQPTARWGGLAALILLLAFLGGIANALGRGEAPDCHCFGIFHSSKAGPSAIYRNALLAAVAAFVVAQGPGPSVTAWISDHGLGEVLAAVLATAAAVAAAIAGRLRNENTLLRSQLERVRQDLARVPPGLPVGAFAPRFDLTKADGGTLALDDLTARGLDTLLIFMDRACAHSREIARDVARWQTTLSERMTIAVVGGGLAEGTTPLDEITDIGFQDGREVREAYHVIGTPSAVLVSPDTRIASSLAQGPTAIEALLRLTLRDASTSFDAVGHRAPATAV